MPPQDRVSEYFEVFERTTELIRRLEAFIEGRETPHSLEAWAQSIWPSDGTQEGPVWRNRMASIILINIWNAADGECPSDEASPSMLRIEDAVDYVRLLRNGAHDAAPRRVGGLKAPLRNFARALGVTPIRHVISGLGWYEIIQFASPATGRLFAMQSALQAPEPCDTTVSTEAKGEAHECLVDMLETLAIDLSDASPMNSRRFKCRSGSCVDRTTTGFRRKSVSLLAIEKRKPPSPDSTRSTISRCIGLSLFSTRNSARVVLSFLLEIAVPNAPFELP